MQCAATAIRCTAMWARNTAVVITARPTPGRACPTISELKQGELQIRRSSSRKHAKTNASEASKRCWYSACMVHGLHGLHGPWVSQTHCMQRSASSRSSPSMTHWRLPDWKVVSEMLNIFWLVVGPPLWKIWKSIGMMRFPIYGKIKNGNQTTNQSSSIHRQAPKKTSLPCQRSIDGWGSSVARCVRNKFGDRGGSFSDRPRCVAASVAYTSGAHTDLFIQPKYVLT